MTMPIAGTAVMRAADAMLRALGGEGITLVLPMPGDVSGTSHELGLSAHGVQQYPLSPVVVRDLPAPASGPAQRVEFLLSVSAVANAVEAQGAASAQALFDAALGIQYQGVLYRIESTTADYFAGTAYLYRVIAVE
jgi:hypothetical protein